MQSSAPMESAPFVIAILLLGACGSAGTAPSPVPAAPDPSAAPPSAAASGTIAGRVVVIGDELDGRDLWVDGARRGPLVRETRLELPAGDHSLEARAGGDVIASRTITIMSGAPDWLELLPLPVPPREAPAPEAPRAPGRVELPTTVRESGEGEFDPAVVVRTLTARRDGILACYERELSNSPDLGGSMTVRMSVRESGTISAVDIFDSTLGPSVEACMEGVIQAIRFAPGPDGGDVTYEFALGFAPAP